MMTPQQRQKINYRDPGAWPRPHRALACIATFTLTSLLGWQVYLEPAMNYLKNLEQEERAMKIAFKIKIQQTATLPAQEEQVLRVSGQLQALQQQLSASDDRHEILEQIAAIARQHALKFEFAKPAQTEIATAYIKHATRIRLSGHYHDLGRFAAAISAMPKIVVLSGVLLSAADNEGVVMDALAMTYQRHPPKKNRSANVAPAAAATP